MSDDEIRRLAKSAVVDLDLIEVYRRKRFGGEVVRGFAIALGKQWLVLHRVDPDFWTVDGYLAVRVADIRKIRRWHEHGSDYPRRALRHYGVLSPEVPPELSPESIESLIVVANQLFPLLGIGEEKVRPNTLAFGKLISVDGRRLKILEIRRDATWYKKTSHFQLSGITWLQFGGHYEEALWAIGGTQ